MSTRKPSVKLIYTISFIDLFAVGLTFPLFYPHLQMLGASHIVIGLFGSAYSGLQVLSGPVIGSWSDLRGRRFVSVVTLLISCFCYFLMGLTTSISILFCIRIILGFVKHTQTLCKALIGDILPKERHAEAYGQSGAISFLGFVVGPIIGGHLSELSDGFFYVCSLTAVLFLINIWLILRLPAVPKQDTTETSTQSSNTATFQTLKTELLKAVTDLMNINWNLYWDAFTLRFLFGFSISIYFSNQALYIKEKFNLSQKLIGYCISFLSIIGFISGLLLGFITKTFYKDDFNCLKRLLHGFIIMCLSLIGLYLTPNVVLFILLLVPFAISSAILRIVSMEVILNRSKNNDRGSLSGACNSVMSISRFVSPLTSGIIGDLFGESSVVLSAFMPSLIGIFLCKRLMYKNRVIVQDLKDK